MSKLTDFAKECEVNGDLKTALDKYNDALDLERDILLCNDIGRIYNKLGKYDDAIESFNRVSKNIDSYVGKGISYFYKFDLDKSLSEFDNALTLDSENIYGVYYSSIICAINFIYNEISDNYEMNYFNKFKELKTKGNDFEPQYEFGILFDLVECLLENNLFINYNSLDKIIKSTDNFENETLSDKISAFKSKYSEVKHEIKKFSDEDNNNVRCELFKVITLKSINDLEEYIENKKITYGKYEEVINQCGEKDSKFYLGDELYDKLSRGEVLSSDEIEEIDEALEFYIDDKSEDLADLKTLLSSYNVNENDINSLCGSTPYICEKINKINDELNKKFKIYSQLFREDCGMSEDQISKICNNPRIIKPEYYNARRSLIIQFQIGEANAGDKSRRVIENNLIKKLKEIYSDNDDKKIGRNIEKYVKKLDMDKLKKIGPIVEKSINSNLKYDIKNDAIEFKFNDTNIKFNNDSYECCKEYGTKINENNKLDDFFKLESKDKNKLNEFGVGPEYMIYDSQDSIFKFDAVNLNAYCEKLYNQLSNCVGEGYSEEIYEFMDGKYAHEIEEKIKFKEDNINKYFSDFNFTGKDVLKYMDNPKNLDKDMEDLVVKRDYLKNFEEEVTISNMSLTDISKEHGLYTTLERKIKSNWGFTEDFKDVLKEIPTVELEKLRGDDDSLKELIFGKSSSIIDEIRDDKKGVKIKLSKTSYNDINDIFLKNLPEIYKNEFKEWDVESENYSNELFKELKIYIHYFSIFPSLKEICEKRLNGVEDGINYLRSEFQNAKAKKERAKSKETRNDWEEKMDQLKKKMDMWKEKQNGYNSDFKKILDKVDYNLNIINNLGQYDDGRTNDYNDISNLNNIIRGVTSDKFECDDYTKFLFIDLAKIWYIFEKYDESLNIYDSLLTFYNENDEVYWNILYLKVCTLLKKDKYYKIKYTLRNNVMYKNKDSENEYAKLLYEIKRNFDEW